MVATTKCLSTMMAIFFGFASMASAAAITAEVDRLKTSREEPFWLTVSIEGDLDGELSIPQSQDFEFTRTGESTNISIINGSISRQRQFTYQLSPLKTGPLTIPSLTAKIDGKPYNSLPIKVEVTGQSVDLANGQVIDDKRLVYVERELPKKIFYEGESVISTVRLLTRARLTGATPARDSAPDWRLIAVEGQKNGEVVRNGTKWNTIEMREGLIPLKSGRLKVPAFGITATWIQPAERSRRPSPGSVFDLFQQGVFNMGREVTRTLRSELAEVEVKPLPLPRPKDFTDIVGAFTLSSSVSKKELNAGDTATVTIQIKGQGALDRMRDLKISPSGSKVYADRPDLNEKIEPGAGLVSVRSMKFAVVPTVAGILDLGEVRITSFNPFTEEYEVLTTQLGKINVGGAAAAAAAAPGVTATVPDQSGNGSDDAANKKILPPDLNDQQNDLSPQKVDILTASSKPWWLAPWVLAVELFVMVLAISWFLIRRLFPQKSFSAETGFLNQWRDLKIDLSRDEALGELVGLLKQEFTRDDQDSKALTSSELLTSDLCKQMPPDVRDSFKRVLEQYDRLAYGKSHIDKSQGDLALDVNRLVEFYKNRT
ncbi:MAG: BatD family protein [bacterium]